jgi:hypothetical protein
VARGDLRQPRGVVNAAFRRQRILGRGLAGLANEVVEPGGRRDP